MFNNSYPRSIKSILNSLEKLPGIGPRSAERLALYIATNFNIDDYDEFIIALNALRNGLRHCEVCNLIIDSEANTCSICKNETREKKKVLLVGESKDVFRFEANNTYNGCYYVIGGLLDFSNGFTPDKLNLEGLFNIINRNNETELIIATDATNLGELTAKYIKEIITNEQKDRPSSSKVLISRIASGLPVGTNFKYIDDKTLEKALDNRKKY